MPTLTGNQQPLSSISSLIGRVFSLFRKKMDGPNPSGVDIKVFILLPTFCLQSKLSIVRNWKIKYCPIRENGKKLWNYSSKWGKTKNDSSLKSSWYFIHFSSFSHSVVHRSLLFRNEEKLLALLVYSSFIRVAIGAFRIVP